MKKLILLIILLTGALCVSATDFTYEGINYTIIDEGAKTCRTNNRFNDYTPHPNVPENLIIPATVYNSDTAYTVTEIGGGSFDSCVDMKSVELPNTVVTIEDQAFGSCGNLKSVKLSDSLVSIGSNAFVDCIELREIYLPETVSSIGVQAFFGCTELQEIYIPETVTSIGMNAFLDCNGLKSINVAEANTEYFSYSGVLYSRKDSRFMEIPDGYGGVLKVHGSYTGPVIDATPGMTSIEIPESVVSIRSFELSESENLISINVAEDNPVYSSHDGVLYSKTKDELLRVPTGKSGTFEIPNSVRVIGFRALFGCARLTSVRIPDSVTTIGDEAFCNCSSLISIELPNSLISLGEYAFGGCENLSSISCHSSYPPTIELWSEPFDKAVYSSAVLNVPSGFSDLYRRAPYWGFSIINDNLPVRNQIRLRGGMNIQIRDGEHSQLDAFVFPADTGDGFIWTSSDENIVTVYDDGTVYAHSPGKAIITVSRDDLRTSCEVEVLPVPVESIFLNFDNIRMEANKSYALTPVILPHNATDKHLDWETSDPSVARVTQYALLESGDIGKATITVKARSGEAQAFFEVEVVPVSVKDLYLSEQEINLYPSDVFRLEADVFPLDAWNRNVIWSSSDENVAKVSDEGLVTAVASGSATIYAKAEDVTAECHVIVNPVSMTISTSNISLERGMTDQLWTTVSPDGYAGEVIWTSSDENVATVSESGYVTALSVGEATLTASCEYAEASCKVEVLPVSVKEVHLNIDNILLDMNEEYQLSATIGPENADDKTVIWSSSNEAVATVSDDGEVETHSVGSTLITAKCGALSSACLVSVARTSVLLDYASLNLEIGDTHVLSATVYPELSEGRAIYWDSANPEIAGISEDGMITAISAGTTVVTARCNSGSAFCAVSVNPSSTITELTVAVDLAVSQSLKLSAFVSSEDIQDPVVWTSSNPEIAEVSAEGMVEAKGVGIALITATCGTYSATCVINVDTTSSGVQNPETEAPNEVVVFNLNGIRMNVSSREELKNLSPGLYIVNDQTELIK